MYSMKRTGFALKHYGVTQEPTHDTDADLGIFEYVLTKPVLTSTQPPGKSVLMDFQSAWWLFSFVFTWIY